MWGCWTKRHYVRSWFLSDSFICNSVICVLHPQPQRTTHHNPFNNKKVHQPPTWEQQGLCSPPTERSFSNKLKKPLCIHPWRKEKPVHQGLRGLSHDMVLKKAMHSLCTLYKKNIQDPVLIQEHASVSPLPWCIHGQAPLSDSSASVHMRNWKYMYRHLEKKKNMNCNL